MAPVTLPPGFRFHPTDEEIVSYYLKRKINGRTIELEVIPEVDLYKCEPWDLPEKSLLPTVDLEWYFFSHRDRKYPNGSRTNRATQAGYWKATGKDRKVISHMRAVGMKKTLVFYRGRAPHGTRTDWVMHEYRLEEKECETASSLQLQDAYALCRVFKKSGIPPKIVEKHSGPWCEHSQWMPKDSSPIMDFSSKRRDDAENSQYFFPSETSSSNIIHDTSFDMNPHGDWRRMQLLAEEVLGFIDPPFQNPGNLAQARSDSSEANAALDCAKLQQWLSLPPLESNDFPQVNLTDSKIQHSEYFQEEPKEEGIFQELLSVTCTSQGLNNQPYCHDKWKGLCPRMEEFFPLSEQEIIANIKENKKCQISEVGSSRFIERRLHGVENSSFHEISDLGKLEEDIAPDNLKGEEMSNTNGRKTMVEDFEDFEDQKVLIDDISVKPKHEQLDHEGGTIPLDIFNNIDVENRASCLEYQSTYFPLGSIDNTNEIFMEDGDVNEFADISTFDIYEKVKVNHGLLISRRNVPETFFHRIEPSKTVISVHLDPIEKQDNVVKKTEKVRKGLNRRSLFSKFKEFAKDSFLWINFSMRLWMESFPVGETMNSVANIVALLWTSGCYLGEASRLICLRSNLSHIETRTKK